MSQWVLRETVPHVWALEKDGSAVWHGMSYDEGLVDLWARCAPGDFFYTEYLDGSYTPNQPVPEGGLQCLPL